MLKYFPKTKKKGIFHKWRVTNVSPIKGVNKSGDRESRRKHV